MHALPPKVRQLRNTRASKRLARAVRKQAEQERRRRLAAGVVDFAALTGRTSLYSEIAAQLENGGIDLDSVGVSRLRRLLADPLPLVDYGPYARARDAEIAAIRDDLQSERR